MALRSLDDFRALGLALAAAERVAIIGGGFIGLEIASAARKLGKPVTVFEVADRLMARAVSPLISKVFADLHESHGVTLHFGAKATGLVGEGGRVAGLATADGAVQSADLVVVGAGARANDELAEAACGLACDNGIVVDECARTADPLIVTAGDCTARRQADGALVRLESVQNAAEQGKSAAAALMGRERPFAGPPWFWSDQHGVKLQMAGQSQGFDEVAIRGSAEARRFTAFYFRGGRLTGATRSTVRSTTCGCVSSSKAAPRSPRRRQRTKASTSREARVCRVLGKRWEVPSSCPSPRGEKGRCRSRCGLPLPLGRGLG